MLNTAELRVIDAETDTCISLLLWFRLEANTHSCKWKATWERKRKDVLLRSPDITEEWFVLDTYEGEVTKIDCDKKEIYVKNYKVISTRADKNAN